MVSEKTMNILNMLKVYARLNPCFGGIWSLSLHYNVVKQENNES